MGQKSGYFNNYSRILKEVRAIAAEKGRSPASVQVLAVTKYASAEQIADLLKGGVDLVAESRLRESLEKWRSPLLKDYKVKKFFIGRLQTNKAAKVVDNFDCICSLDSLHLAQAVERHAAKLGRNIDCLVQIKLTDRETQGGIAPEEAGRLIEDIRKDFKHITLKGLMAIAPDTSDEELLRSCFKKAKSVFDAYFKPEDCLSLGMSGDYKIAVAEGSNLPRIGSAVFK
ncbi:MAG: YggS family pyridoxal phosphate-dependent enzyme [Elusimicrobia bacterium]|nr:YggS family pyridoxal phosphate-dependent enzyme [Elusimicrobiota bacterium]